MPSVDEIVELMRVSRHTVHADPKQHFGVSDHLMHCVKIEILETLNGWNVHRFRLATFNVLYPDRVQEVAGRTKEGRPLMSAYDTSLSSGLEMQPLADFGVQEKRLAAIVNMICEFFEQDDLPCVVCLQDCTWDIVADVLKRVKHVTRIEGNHTLFGRRFTLTKKCAVVGTYCGSGMLISFLRIGEIPFKIVITNVDFNDDSNMSKAMDVMHEVGGKYRCVLAGTFASPCAPLSSYAQNINLNQLSTFVKSYLCEKYGWRHEMAMHNQGFTNWRPRRYFEFPEEGNADHSDNIIFLTDGLEERIDIIPLPEPLPGRWWE